jgi:hypothetical protein
MIGTLAAGIGAWKRSTAIRLSLRAKSCAGTSVRRAERSVSFAVWRRIHSDGRRLRTANAERSAPHS